MFEGFTLEYVDVGEVTLRVVTAATGSPWCCCTPSATHTTWHRVAPQLAGRSSSSVLTCAGRRSRYPPMRRSTPGGLLLSIPDPPERQSVAEFSAGDNPAV